MSTFIVKSKWRRGQLRNEEVVCSEFISRNLLQTCALTRGFVEKIVRVAKATTVDELYTFAFLHVEGPSWYVGHTRTRVFG